MKPTITVSPGTAVTGFGPATVSGSIHAGDGVAVQAQAGLATAYAVAAAQPDGALDGLTLGAPPMLTPRTTVAAAAGADSSALTFTTAPPTG